jgi:hypothetical protein
VLSEELGIITSQNYLNDTSGLDAVLPYNNLPSLALTGVD